ncbi:MAG TPA: hypothetical protein DDZ42_22885, partial [Candidatus Rokubacteria bacterium]|nr:hypothetical protein [Candidatus Rokubacteria bacterium]
AASRSRSTCATRRTPRSTAPCRCSTPSSRPPASGRASATSSSTTG